VPRFVELQPPSDCTALGDCDAAYFPHLVVSAPPLQFSAPAGGFLQREYVQVRNGGGGVLFWTASVAYQNGSGWVSIFPESGVDNTTIWFDAHPETLSPGTYQATLTVDAGPLAGSRSLPVTFTVTSAAPAAPAVSSVTNAASFLPGVASGTWITILGTNLAHSTRTWDQSDFSGTRLPTELDGVSVNINGRPSYVSYISPTQVNALAPDDTAEGLVMVEVVTPGGTSQPVSAWKEHLSPGFFLFDAEGRKYAASVHADGTYLGKPNLLPGLPSRPAKPGDIVQLYGTGFGSATPALPVGELVTTAAQLAEPPSVRIGGVAANVVWAGLVAPGLYQLNVTVPEVPDGDQPVVAERGEFRTQANVYVTVQR
jgi:uncharacterized protein (TIGR03437 family)